MGVEPVSLHHVAVVTQDLVRAQDFYSRVLGLRPHASKPNWLLAGRHGAVHLLERRDLAPDGSVVRRLSHLAIQVRSLERARDRLLAAGVVPFQLSLEFERRDVDATSDLDWGLGTLFMSDPDGNSVELVQAGRGIFAEHARDDMRR